MFKLLNSMLFCLIIHYILARQNFFLSYCPVSSFGILIADPLLFSPFSPLFLPFPQHMAENSRQFFEMGNTKVEGLKCASIEFRISEF